MMRSKSRRRNSVDIRIPNGNNFSTRFLGELSDVLFADHSDIKTEYLKEHLFSKYADPTQNSAAVRKSRAIAKWLAQERRNSDTNVRLFVGEHDFGWCTSERFFRRVRATIGRILGPLPYDRVLVDLQHTNGASTRVKRSASAAIMKLVGNAHVSDSALKHWLVAASSENGRLSSQELTPSESSVLFTVPKKSDIDRVACKEPEINMLLQRSVGIFIRRRLRSVGINLLDQTSNQRLARQAVASGLATIDLSSASDSISSQIVTNCLPFDWWSLLDDLRVKSTLIDGNLHTLEMFSSMGNGFTFELESLLFYAITRVCCEMSRVRGRVSVYGDDIIAPCAIVPRLIRLFHWLGFRVNESKTFWRGMIRESCGKHYYGTFDISPFFVRRAVTTYPDLINLLNQILNWSGRGWGFITDPPLAEFHLRYSRVVPSHFWGGVSVEDNSCLVTGHSPRFRITPDTKEVGFDDSAGLTHWFMSRGEEDDNQDVVSLEPEATIGFRKSRVSKGWLTEWNPWIIISKDSTPVETRFPVSV